MQPLPSPRPCGDSRLIPRWLSMRPACLLRIQHSPRRKLLACNVCMCVCEQYPQEESHMVCASRAEGIVISDQPETSIDKAVKRKNCSTCLVPYARGAMHHMTRQACACTKCCHLSVHQLVHACGKPACDPACLDLHAARQAYSTCSTDQCCAYV